MFHYVTLRHGTLRFVTLHLFFLFVHSTPEQILIKLGYYNHITLRYVTWRYVTLRYVTLRNIALHYITLRYVTLRYVALHFYF